MPGQEHLELVDDDGLEHHVIVAGLSRTEFDVLVDDHPPRPDQTETWNEDTLAPELIARCCGVDLVTAERRWNDWPVDAAEELFETCLRLSARGSLEWATRRLQRDPRLALEARVCLEHGLDLDEFQARSTRSQDLTLAAYLLSKDRCPGCGIPTEAMDDPEAGDVAQRECVHCESKQQAEDAVPEARRASVHTWVVPVERAG